MGRHLLKLLSSLNYEIIIVDKSSNRNDNLYSVNNNSITFYKQDIVNRNAVFDIFSKEKIDSCIHLAAKIDTLDSILNPYDTLDVNVRGTLNLLEACSNHGVRRFVFASSGAVYGEPKQLPTKEDHPLDPLSPYAASKAAAELLVSAYGNLKKIEQTISLRFVNVFGKGQSIYAGVIAAFLERLSRGLAPIIYGDGNQTRDFISVNDAVNAILLAVKLDNKISCRDVLNIATGRSVSINDLARLMIGISELDLEPIYEPERKADIKFARADVTKSKNILTFKASGSLESELELMIKHVISQSNKSK
jgi:UDP-glucose 4-epimerase